MIIIKDVFPSVTIHQADSFDSMMKMLTIRSYDLLILDINMSGGNNFQMIDAIRMKQPDIKILMFSAYEEQLYAMRYLQAGVNGYLQKNSSEKEVKNALESILYKGHYTSSALRDHLMNNLVNKNSSNPIESLSNREIEVAKFIVQGESVLNIARYLNIQVSTVSTYKNRIFEKLGVNNVAELIEKFRLYGGLTI
jgi:two-component system, NarL family, invasion response regulator UvrY